MLIGEKTADETAYIKSVVIPQHFSHFPVPIAKCIKMVSNGVIDDLNLFYVSDWMKCKCNIDKADSTIEMWGSG